MSYYQHPIKCLNCGLHFVICSNYEKWPNEGTIALQNTGETSGLIYCPECGHSGKNVVDGMLQMPVRKTEGFIFQMV